MKLEAYHQSRQPQSSLSPLPLFWDFGSLFMRRCGVILASCCGSSNLSLHRRCGVLVASCCGSGSSPFIDVAASMADCCGSSNSKAA